MRRCSQQSITYFFPEREIAEWLKAAVCWTGTITYSAVAARFEYRFGKRLHCERGSSAQMLRADFGVARHLGVGARWRRPARRYHDEFGLLERIGGREPTDLYEHVSVLGAEEVSFRSPLGRHRDDLQTPRA